MTTDARPPARLKCPHCLVACYMPVSKSTLTVGNDSDGDWGFDCRSCPNCSKVVIWLIWSEGSPDEHSPRGSRQWILIRPKVSGRPPVPPEVPEEFASDYREACLVIADSPKASAALSRRCLQLILRKKLGAQGRDPP